MAAPARTISSQPHQGRPLPEPLPVVEVGVTCTLLVWFVTVVWAGVVSVTVLVLVSVLVPECVTVEVCLTVDVSVTVLVFVTVVVLVGSVVVVDRLVVVVWAASVAVVSDGDVSVVVAGAASVAAATVGAAFVSVEAPAPTWLAAEDTACCACVLALLTALDPHAVSAHANVAPDISARASRDTRRRVIAPGAGAQLSQW